MLKESLYELNTEESKIWREITDRKYFEWQNFEEKTSKKGSEMIKGGPSKDIVRVVMQTVECKTREILFKHQNG